MERRLSSILGGLTVVTVLVGLVAAAPNDVVDIIVVSDFHVDTLYGTARGLPPCNTSAAVADAPFGRFGCDAPWSLVESAWSDISQQRFDFVAVLGDWLRHHSDRLTAPENMAAFGAITRLAAASVANHSAVVPVPSLATAFGNNDFVPDYNFDYRNTTRAPLFVNFTATLREEGLLSVGEHETFLSCGYFSRTMQAGGLRLIALNTVLWDESLKPAAATGEDPCDQFEFLEAELKLARLQGQAAWIVGHVPPTVNLYPLERHGPNPNASNSAFHFFTPTYERRFLATVSEFQPTIRAMFFAHTHHFAFSADLFVGVPVFILGAVSPVYRNWPNYLKVKVAPITYRVLDVRQRWFNLTSQRWADGVSLVEAYNMSSGPSGAAPAVLDVSTLHRVARQLVANGSAYTVWRKMDAGGVIEDPCVTRYCRELASCFGSYLGTAAVFRCLASHGEAMISGP